MVVTNVTSSAHFFSLIQKPQPTIVDYTATWCGPCRVIKPYFEQLAKTFLNVQFLSVDVDHLQEVSHWAQIRAIKFFLQRPTFAAYNCGRKIGEVVGMDKKALYELITKISK